MEKKLDLIPLKEWNLFNLFNEKRPLLMAGPCSAESEIQIMETARGLKAMGISVFRAGIWKPRTHPNTFEGVGTPGLKWMQRVKNELGMKICTEVASEKHIFDCIKFGVDMVWIGARTTANPFLVQEIADALKDTDIPVLVKNPVNPDIDLWIGALERLNQAGVKKLGVIHRGFSTSEKIPYRNRPDWQIAIELRSRYPELPFFCDPSHLGGAKEYLLEISQRAMDLGLDGLMIESHCDPTCALSDAKQQLTPKELEEMMTKLTVRDADSDSPEYKENIHQLRLENGHQQTDRRVQERKQHRHPADIAMGFPARKGYRKGQVAGAFGKIHSYRIQCHPRCVRTGAERNPDRKRHKAGYGQPLRTSDLCRAALPAMPGMTRQGSAEESGTLTFPFPRGKQILQVPGTFFF